MADEFFMAAGTLFTVCFVIVFIPTALVGMFFFWQRRDHQPIKARNPWMALLLDVLVIALVVGLAAQRLSGDNYPCFLSIASSFVAVITLCNVYACKCWVLFFKFELTRQRLEFQSTEEQSFLIRLQHYTSGPFLVKIAGSITIMMLLAPALLIAASEEIQKARGDKDCSFEPVETCLLIYAGIYVVFFVGFAWKLRAVIDGFWIKNELIWTLFVGVGFMALWYLFNSVFVTLNEGYFAFSTASLLFAATGVFTLSTLVPLYKTLVVTKDSQLRDPTTSELDDLKTLEGILNTPEGTDAFTEFLTKEFSVENILFYRAIEELRQKILEREVKQMKDPSADLEDSNSVYKKYVVVGSSWQVNLPSDIMQNIQQQLEFKTEQVAGRRSTKPAEFVKRHTKLWADIKVPKTPKTVFDVAQQDIYNLMESDSVPRFLRCKELYNKLVTDLEAKRRQETAFRDMGIA